MEDFDLRGEVVEGGKEEEGRRGGDRMGAVRECCYKRV